MISEAAAALDVREAHLLSMLALVAVFATADAREIFEPRGGRVHVFAVCTLLFIQIMGRHIFETSAQDHWPDFQGANEAAVEQVELSKAAPSRSRPSNSRAGVCILRRMLGVVSLKLWSRWIPHEETTL
jgi:hypothetical protein